MKKIFTYVVLMMSMCLLTACPNDDDDDEGGARANTPSKPFAGYWKIKLEKGTTNMLFYNEGKLLHNGKEFIWNYDEKNQLLSTTDNDYQWEVTLADSTAWSGIALWGSKSSVTNYRAEARETAKQILTGRDWIYNDTVWKFVSDYDSNYKLKYKSGDNERYLYNRDGFDVSSVKESIKQGRINIKAGYTDHDYSGYWTGNSQIIATVSGVCNIRIDNPYSYDNVRVTCHLTYRYVSSTGEVKSNTSKDMVLKPKARK